MPHSNKKMISFFLTTKCNLCCRYCYNAKERNCIVEQTLNFEIAKNGIDWYFNNNPSRHIRFYGPGEPTQEFEMLKRITEYAKNHPNRGWKMYTGRKPEQVYFVMKMKKNRMERNLKKNEKRYSSEPEVMLIWCWVKI